MKLVFGIILVFTAFSLYANSDLDYRNEIISAPDEEKENIYLEWINFLSQNHNLLCDSIIDNRSQYVTTLSEDGKLTLVLIHLNNTRVMGQKVTPEISAQLNESDKQLIQAIVSCYSNNHITNEEYKKLVAYEDLYQDPTRKTLLNIALTCQKDLDLNEKSKYFKEALQYSLQSKVRNLHSTLLDVSADLYLEKENFEGAIIQLQKGTVYAKQHALYANLVLHLMKMGHIHSELGNLNKAEEAYLEALELKEGREMDFVFGRLYNYLGRLHYKSDKLSESLRYYQLALLSFYNIKNIPGLASTHKNIGEVYCQKKDYDLAMKNYKLSEEFYSNLKRNKSKGQLYYNIAKLYYRTEKLEKAEENVKKSIHYWEKSQQSILLHQALLLYSEIKQKQNDWKTAYNYLLRYQHFTDSIHEYDTKRKVAELSELFRSEQKERKIIEQEKRIKEEHNNNLLVQNKLKSTKRQSQLILIILIISLLLSVSIFIIIRNKNKQENLKKKQKEIELQQALLRTQMNPHFIFNAMSVIQSYIYDEDVSNSSKFLILFSKLMRMILENNAKEFISLEIELEIIKLYLTLQKMRFEERFDFEIINNVEDTSSIAIPPMMVQPFIENAIEHGELDKVKNGLIRIECDIKDDLFIFTIRDNGIGINASMEKKTTKTHKSMAIQLTKDRIALLNKKYKSEGYLHIKDIKSNNSTGTKVTIATQLTRSF